MKDIVPDYAGLTEALTRIETRLSRIESYLGLVADEHFATGEQIPGKDFPPTVEGGATGLEIRIGEFGLAWVGSIIFSLGIVFLVTYIHNLGYGAAATVLGYASAAILFMLAARWVESYSHLSGITTACSLGLVYYTTLRLHFFSSDKLVPDRTASIILLLIVVGLQFYLSIRKSGQWMAEMAILVGLATAVIIDGTHLSLPLVAAIAVGSVFLSTLNGWRRLVIWSIIAVYLTHLLWLLNNPVLGHAIGGVKEHQYNILYLFSYAIIFAAAPLAFRQPDSSTDSTIAIIILNCLGFSFVSLLVTLTHYQGVYAWIYLGVAIMFSGIAILQWLRTRYQITAAAYACFGFLGLSISIYGFSTPPLSFLWLSLQSLLVVSMALWFRSKVLVVVNTIIFLGIVSAYMITSPASHAVDFTLVLVAHASARVMNWQKERLTLQTELLRNIYLASAFLLVLTAVYRIAPLQYVTLCWTLAAAVYFVLSSLLGNIKYRWIAMGVLLVTVVHLFVIDLGRLGPTYRVVAFLVLGLMSLLISLFYTRIRRLISKS